MAQVSFTDNQPVREIVSPFRSTSWWRGVAVALRDGEGDGVPDSLLFQARHGRQKAMRIVAL
jgi:hypothetical protein